MKPTLLILIAAILSMVAHAQNRSGVNQSTEGMVLVPKGSFSFHKDSIQKSIATDAFWMSNEITNKEFREFYDQLKNTPNDTIRLIDLKRMETGSKPGMKPTVVKLSHSDIIKTLMVDSVWNSVPGKENYFRNSKYDNYPVVGVTCHGATYYCIWKTEQENKKLKKQGNKAIMDYRLPTEFEWEYAATLKPAGKDNQPLNDLHEVLKGDKNEIGLCNLAGNVSEWTLSSKTNNNRQVRIVRGGSWKTGLNSKTREFVNPDKATNYIGFRMVKSFLGEK